MVIGTGIACRVSLDAGMQTNPNNLSETGFLFLRRPMSLGATSEARKNIEGEPYEMFLPGPLDL